MGEIVKEVTVDAPIGEVYSYVADPWNAPRYISSITKIISGPDGHGAKGDVWRAEANFLGQKREINLRLHDTVPNKAVRFVLEGDPQAVLVVRLSSAGAASTNVTLSLDVPSVPTIFLNALLGGLLGTDLERLRKNLGGA